MQMTTNRRTIELVTGDITQQRVDAIVNAANSQLAGGSGVDGAIHRVGGPSIMRETNTKYPTGCPTGGAVLSGAGNLPARFRSARGRPGLAGRRKRRTGAVSRRPSPLP